MLNETEINYKAARNKRLHVELALIKLCYLQQAIELVGNGDVVSKKKLAETSKAIAFRNIVPIEAPRKKEEQKIITKPEAGVGSNRAKLLIETTHVEEKILVEERTETYQTTSQQNTQPVTAKVPTLGALSKLRKEVAGRQQAVVDDKIKPLTHETLKEAWIQFAQQLRLAKNPAVQSFELAILKITNDIFFEAITNNNLEQKFIEQEKEVLPNSCKRYLIIKHFLFLQLLVKTIMFKSQLTDR